MFPSGNIAENRMKERKKGGKECATKKQRCLFQQGK